MGRLSRKLRVCKRAGTVGCVLIAAAFLWCGWWMLSLLWATQQCGYFAWLSDGCITIGRVMWLPSSDLGWHLLVRPRPDSPHFHFALLPGILPTSPSAYRYVSLPLWIPFLVLLIPTLLLWRRDRRKPRPGFCRRCDYDLTGNTSGCCPECGLAITE